mmetsp:Transcript_97811/g.169390  ORF Transcript_97811/g.169390 Transcript_97811/m.169390 type:complete len:112 (+) Transcript_97811:2-337(+)
MDIRVHLCSCPEFNPRYACMYQKSNCIVLIGTAFHSEPTLPAPAAPVAAATAAAAPRGKPMGRRGRLLAKPPKSRSSNGSLETSAAELRDRARATARPCGFRSSRGSPAGL